VSSTEGMRNEVCKGTAVLVVLALALFIVLLLHFGVLLLCLLMRFPCCKRD